MAIIELGRLDTASKPILFESQEPPLIKGWIVMGGFDCEGLCGMDAPYEVFFDEAAADRELDRMQREGRYDDFYKIEVLVP